MKGGRRTGVAEAGLAGALATDRKAGGVVRTLELGRAYQ